MVKYVFLTREFYKDYITCSEIEQKDNRQNEFDALRLGIH